MSNYRDTFDFNHFSNLVREVRQRRWEFHNSEYHGDENGREYFSQGLYYRYGEKVDELEGYLQNNLFEVWYS